jgi:Eukaryotic aspartyl protease
MTSVGITKPNQPPKLYAPSSNNPKGQAVFLDSGGTLSRLPTPLFNAIVADFPSAVIDPSGSGLYIVPCSVANEAGTVDFGFGNTVIHVSYHEFIWFAGPNICFLGILANDEEPVLGGKCSFQSRY